jgi:predicted double-glycine peptidase
MIMAAFNMTCRVGGILLALATSASPAVAQITVGSGLRVAQPARSMRDLRDQNLVKQRFDFSCGAAALATLLRYGLGDDVTEAQVLTQLFALLSDNEKTTARANGFSLLHLQRVAQARGHAAEGYRLEPAQVSMLAGPVIVFIEPRGYKHFAVLRGVRGDRVYLADPSRGNIRMPMYAFLESWLQDDGKGIVFVVEPKGGLPEKLTSLAVAQAGDREGLVRPEILSVREMMAVGNAVRPVPRPAR